MTARASKTIQTILRAYVTAVVYTAVSVLILGGPNWPSLPLLCLTYGFSFGTSVLAYNWLRPHLRSRSLVRNSLSATLGLVVTVLTAVFLGVLLTAWAQGKNPLQPAYLRGFVTVLRTTEMQLVLLFAATAISVGIAVQEVSRKLGPGVMGNWILGKYSNPRQETRAVMFLDLVDSTSLAETLGDLRFSALLRDFMGEITEPVLATKASIHTYIGDGVVLSWPGGKVNESLRFHHLLQARIERNTSFYRERYGEAPRYRLGLHIGEVVVTEIGELKSDIVLHGDTVNTTSRIQTMCRPLGFQVLASQEWIAAIADSSSWRDLGEHPLKGKIHPVRLFTHA